MQSSTEAAALNEVPCIDLFLVKCGITIFHFFFSFFYQLDCVMCSRQKCPCEHSNFPRQLINLYCLKKSSQVEGTKSDYDILCVSAPLCARVCVCVSMDLYLVLFIVATQKEDISEAKKSKVCSRFRRQQGMKNSSIVSKISRPLNIPNWLFSHKCLTRKINIIFTWQTTPV